MKLAQIALRNPYTVIVGVLAVLVLGLTRIARMPADMLPRFATPAVQVVTFYPGMPAEVMEKDITTRLERWTGQSAGIARQESRSMIAVSIVKDFFHEDVDPASAIAQVSSCAMSDLFYLPPGTIPPMVMPFDPTASVPLALITVSSPKFDETKLYDMAYFDLRNRLQGISGVIAPAVYGGKLRRILAYVDRGRLDAPVLVRDVGEVEDSNQIQTNAVRISAPPDFEGKRQVYIPIYRQPGSNTIQIVDGIRAALGSILARLSEGIHLNVVMDQSVYVRQAIRNLVREGWLGGGLAALMVLFFIGNVLSTLMITAAIPLSILAAFIGLYLTGNSIDAMVLGGLEGVQRHTSSPSPAVTGSARVILPLMEIIGAEFENRALRPMRRLPLRPGECVGIVVVRSPDLTRWDQARLSKSAAADDKRLAGEGLGDWAAALDDDDRRLSVARFRGGVQRRRCAMIAIRIPKSQWGKAWRAMVDLAPVRLVASDPIYEILPAHLELLSGRGFTYETAVEAHDSAADEKRRRASRIAALARRRIAERYGSLGRRGRRNDRA